MTVEQGPVESAAPMTLEHAQVIAELRVLRRMALHEDSAVSERAWKMIDDQLDVLNSLGVTAIGGTEE